MTDQKVTKSRLLWLLFSAVFFVLAIVLTFNAGKIGLVYSYTDGEPDIVAKNFFNGILSYDYDTAVHYLSDCTKINLENPNEGDGAKLYEKLLNSYSYKIVNVETDGIDSEITVDFTSLDLVNLEKTIKTIIEDLAQELSETMEFESVYKEDLSYTEEFENLVIETLFEKINKTSEYVTNNSVKLNLKYTKGNWMIQQTPDLSKVLSGGVIKGKQTASVLNLSSTIGKSVDRIINKANSELNKVVVTPTFTPTPTATPTPTPTLAPGITPTPKPYRVSTADYVLDEYEKVAPVPNPDNFGYTDDPMVIMELLEREEAKKLLNGQQVSFRPDRNFDKNRQIGYYLDETILAITWTENSPADQHVEPGSYLTFAEVVIADGSQLRRKLAGDSFGSGVELKATELAKSVNAVVAIDGDFYSYKKKGICVFEHKVCREMLNDSTDTCFFRTDGEMLFTRPGFFKSTEEVQKFVDDNDISFAITFGPIIIENYKVINHTWYPVGEVIDWYSRSSFGMLGDKHYLLMTANWEFTLDRAAIILCDRGVEKAYALDGGQSAIIALGGDLRNYVSFGRERLMSDIIYFATALPSE